MSRAIDVLLWAGGLGTRLQPLTFENLGDRVITRRPKGVLPLAGLPLLCRVLQAVFDGIASAGWVLAQLFISTTADARPRVANALAQLGDHKFSNPTFVIGAYEMPGERFLRSLSEVSPCLSCHDDTIVAPSVVASLLQSFAVSQGTVIATSAQPSEGSVPVSPRQQHQAELLPQPLAPSAFHAPLRIYSPRVLPLAREIVHEVEHTQGSQFREFMLDSLLLERGLAIQVPVLELLNINSARDYLRALRHVLGDGYYCAPNTRCATTSSLQTVAIEGYCEIGKITARSAAIFPSVTIGDDCVLDECMIGEATTVAPGISICGSTSSPVVIGNFKSVERSILC